MRIQLLPVLLLTQLLWGPAGYADASKCLSVSVFGLNPQAEQAVFHQLKTELKTPIFQSPSPDCGRLEINVVDRTATITLNNDASFNTTIHLDDFPRMLWPRAIALSTFGLWILAKDAEADSKPPKQPDQKRDMASSRLKTAIPSADTQAPRMSDSAPSVSFHGALGVHFVPKYRIGLVDAALGAGLFFAPIDIRFSAVGMWGQKSFRKSRIVTVGGGLRTALLFRALDRKRLAVGIGPAAEILAVLGYGAGDKQFVHEKAIRPVANIMAQIDGALALFPEFRLHLNLSGGISAVYFDMQIDGSSKSGLRGGFVKFAVGISMGETQ